MLSFSLELWLASSTTMAVSSFDSEAIGAATSASLLNNTSPVTSSTTNACRELSHSGSPAPGKGTAKGAFDGGGDGSCSVCAIDAGGMTTSNSVVSCAHAGVLSHRQSSQANDERANGVIGNIKSSE